MWALSYLSPGIWSRTVARDLVGFHKLMLGANQRSDIIQIVYESAALLSAPHQRDST